MERVCSSGTVSDGVAVMRCYVDGHVCTCDLDEISIHSCHKDGPDEDSFDETFDPLRAGELSDEAHLFYLNGLRA